MLDLPVETLELIITTASNVHELWDSKHKTTLLTCAFVCRTWMAVSRRLLLTLYFPTGRVKVRPETNHVLTLVEVFRPPICTLDPEFIKVLDFTTEMPTKSPHGVDLQNGPFAPQPLFSVLLAIGTTLFPSLHTIELESNLLPSGKCRNDDSLDPPSLSILSQVRTLVIHTTNPTSFIDIVGVILLCYSVEEVNVSLVDDGRYGRSNPDLYPLPCPPKSLRKLVLDMKTLYEMALWTMTCRPPHNNISSLTLSGFLWNRHIKSSFLRMFLDKIGRKLEDLVLGIADYTPGCRWNIAFRYTSGALTSS